MDFVKGNEIVKIDPHAIDLCGNNQITLGTEIITIDNKKFGTESSVTTLAPDYIKLTGYETQQPTGQEGVITLNRAEGKLTTYLNGTWTNILTGTTSISTINDSRIKITGAYNTVANGIYNKNDSFSTNNANGDVYVNENGLYIEKDFNVSDQGNDPNWQQGPSNTDMEAYEYYVASDRTLDEHRTNAASMNAHLTSIVSAAENQYIHDIIQASGVSSAIPERVFIGLQPAPGYDWYSDMGSGVDISIENSDSNNMNLWEWSDGTQYEPGYGNFTNWYWYSIWQYPVNYGLHSYYTAGCALYLEREVGNDVAPPNKWVPAKSENYRAVYKRRLKSTDIWKIYYDILGTKHTLYELYYTNTQNTRSLLSANIGSSDISGYDYINNNKSISNDTINLSTITVNLDPAINIAVNHPIYGGTYTTATSLSNNHHLEWNYGNYKITWATVDDNINLNTNKLGWCLLDNSVIKYYSSGMTVDGITNGSSNPWDTDLRWEAVDGVNLTLPIINASNLNTSLEKNLQDWVINITDSSYEKANGTYRRDRSENINNRHVYYNEHGLKLYYGALEYDGETPNNNTISLTSYTQGTWISPTSGSLTTNYGASIDGTNPDSLIGYEYKITSGTHSTWNDAETAAKNEYAHLASFQTYGEEQHLQNIIPNDGNYTWLGLYYDGTNISSSGTDSGWKFIDRTRTFSEGTTNTLLSWDTPNSHPLTESNSGAIYTYLTDSDIIRNHANGANYRAIFKRPQMWIQGTGSLTEYEYLLVNVGGYTWQQHENKAQELGGHLISIHSYEELQFIKTKFGSVSSTAPDNNLFIGLRTSQPDNVWNATTNNDWYYTDGTPFDYQFWGSTYPTADSAGARYGTSGVYGWTASFTSTDAEMFNNKSDENCIAIYKRKRNSWRIVDGKDTIYRFGEPTVTNTGSYVDSVTSLVMQPKYRNDHTDESSRVIDGNYVTRTVANLTITGHINTDYNGVYNYSNFKSDSTRKWVNSTTPSITLEYKETDNPLEQQPQYRWGIYNNNVLAMIGNIHINPWGDSGSIVTWGYALPTLTRWGNYTATPYNLVNGTYAQAFNYDPDDPAYSDDYPTTGQRGPGYLWTFGQQNSWGTFAFTPETYFFNQTPGVVSYFGVNQTRKNYFFICIYPANKTDAELVPNNSWVSTDVTDMFHIHWSWQTKKWYYYKDGTEITNIHQDNTDSFQSIEITYEPDNDGVYQYYMNFFARSAGTDPYAVNYPYDVKSRVPGTDRYLLAGGSNNAFIKHGFKLGYLPYRIVNTGDGGSSTWGGEPRIYTRWIYHDKLYSECDVQKEVTATTNTETNLQITGQLSGAGPTTSINLEYGITMTEGSGASDSTVSVDKTNGVNIQNTDLAITDGNIIVNGAGNVGIGTTQPESTLDVKGKVFISAPGVFGHTRNEMGGVGGHPANGTLSSAIREAQLQINSNVASYLNPDQIPGMKLYIGVFSNNNRSFLQSGNPQVGHDWQGELLLNPQGGLVTSNHNTVTSDDRIKINEEYITNGLEIVNKLKPQIYDKINIIDDVNNLKNIDISGQTYRESGFIVQDIYYDIPELRHNIRIPHGIIPSESRELTGDDPKIDPDYSSWGPDPTSLNYIGLTPYLANAIQELSRRNDEKSAKILVLEQSNQEKDEKLLALEERITSIEKLLKDTTTTSTSDNEETNTKSTSLFKKV